MKYFILTILGAALISFSKPAKAQIIYDLHLSVGGGVDYYVGDLKDNFLPFPTKFLNPFLTVQLKYRYNRNFTFGIGYFRGKLTGADQWGRTNTLRDFAFESKLRDYNIFAKIRVGNFYRESIFTPTVIAGAGYFRFDPMRDGVSLRALGTEGQLLGGNYPAPYRPWSIALKLGPEFTFYVTSWLDVDVYVIYNKTFTDYIDDVSGAYPNYTDLVNSPGGEATANYTYRYINGSIPPAGADRGNSTYNDGFFYIGANLTFWLFQRDREGGRIKCPDYDKFMDPSLKQGKKKKKRRPEEGELR